MNRLVQPEAPLCVRHFWGFCVFVRVATGYSSIGGAVVFRGKGGGWRSGGCLRDSGCAFEGTHWAPKGAIRGIHPTCWVVDLPL